MRCPYPYVARPLTLAAGRMQALPRAHGRWWRALSQSMWYREEASKGRSQRCLELAPVSTYSLLGALAHPQTQATMVAAPWSILVACLCCYLCSFLYPRPIPPNHRDHHDWFKVEGIALSGVPRQEPFFVLCLGVSIRLINIDHMLFNSSYHSLTTNSWSFDWVTS
jgi:hypothetical protein